MRAGYQIAGIGNRTTIADGNTWNHEHIATLGRCLTAPEKHAHRIIRHLADYVLLWTGGGERTPRTQARCAPQQARLAAGHRPLTSPARRLPVSHGRFSPLPR